MIAQYLRHRLRYRKITRARLAVAAACAALGLVLASSAAAVSFQVDFVSSTYDTQVGDTFSDLLARHGEGSPIQSTVTQGFEDISSGIYANGVTTDYSLLLTTTIEIVVAGTYTFQVGTDWGRGGATALIDNWTGAIVSERVIDDDVWWANSWNNPDVFTTTFDFAAGDSYTLMWVGFEGCCGGSTTLRFSVDGAPYSPLTEPNIVPYVVPEPGSLVLIGGGLAAISLRRRRYTLEGPVEARSSPLEKLGL